MRLSSLARMAWMAVLCALLSGCGDTFRPVATPLPQPSPDPQQFRLAVLTSCIADPQSGQCLANAANGAAADINVSGDTQATQTTVGRSPVYALVEFNRVITADRDSDTVTSFINIQNTIAGGTAAQISGQNSTTLPAGASPVFVADVNGNIYVAESGLGRVGVLNGGPLALSTEVPVGSNPVALAAQPNGANVYVVNKGSGTVSVLSMKDNTVAATLTVGASPVWAVASADSNRVYVVNQGSNSVSVIDTGSQTVINTVPVGSSPNYIFFDAKLLRAYVTNQGSNTLSVINADPNSPLYLNVTSVGVGSNPSSVTALADGTRVYVASTGSGSVSVVNSFSLALTKTITVGKGPVWIASSGDSSKVFVANRDSGNLSVIRTLNDTELTDSNGNPMRIPAPKVDPTCTSNCTRQNPVFVAVTPG